MSLSTEDREEVRAMMREFGEAILSGRGRPAREWHESVQHNDVKLALSAHEFECAHSWCDTSAERHEVSHGCKHCGKVKTDPIHKPQPKRKSFAEALGADVSIPVSSPAEGLAVYRERQAEIRRSRPEMEARQASCCGKWTGGGWCGLQPGHAEECGAMITDPRKAPSRPHPEREALPVVAWRMTFTNGSVEVYKRDYDYREVRLREPLTTVAAASARIRELEQRVKELEGRK